MTSTRTAKRLGIQQCCIECVRARCNTCDTRLSPNFGLLYVQKSTIPYDGTLITSWFTLRNEKLAIKKNPRNHGSSYLSMDAQLANILVKQNCYHHESLSFMVCWNAPGRHPCLISPTARQLFPGLNQLTP